MANAAKVQTALKLSQEDQNTIASLKKEIEKIQKEVGKSKGKLGNEKFVANAKPEVVAVERERLAEWEGKLAQLQEMRTNLT